MSKMNEESQNQEELRMLKEFAVMEIKMRIMTIMFEQPTADAKVAAIAEYILGKGK